MSMCEAEASGPARHRRSRRDAAAARKLLALELRMWHTRVPRLSEPDSVVFDLHPAGAFDAVVTVASALRTRLVALGPEGGPKTSGKRGLHVLVPLVRGDSYEPTTGRFH